VFAEENRIATEFLNPTREPAATRPRSIDPRVPFG